jgi:glucokinase
MIPAIGIDIGGTKCAVVYGTLDAASARIAAKRRFATPRGFPATLTAILAAIEEVTAEAGLPPRAVGISCGGPLNRETGRILSPPNLPGWDNVDIVTPLRAALGVPVALENDANAGALAEWRWGAGQGFTHFAFLTFGTGIGAGLILNGALYRGATDLAGEIGHVRLAADGPRGYGKDGSVEGFCGGGSIAQWAHGLRAQWLSAHRPTELADVTPLTAQAIGEAAEHGDPLALTIWDQVGFRLGQSLAMILDLLNPEAVILGGIYLRQQHRLEPSLRAALAQEALPATVQACRILPAGLGEAIGDYASLAVAAETLA